MHDKEYLQSLSQQDSSITETSLSEYTEQQMEKSDMFLFLRYVNPTAYRKFIRDDGEELEIQKTAESIIKK
jgi:hypothetical protein